MLNSLSYLLTFFVIYFSLCVSRCKRASLECERGDIDCYRKPATITYHFITLISNLALPPTGRVLFTYKGPNWYQNVDFEMKLVHAQTRSDVKRVSDKSFRYVEKKMKLRETCRSECINLSKKNVFFPLLAWTNSKMRLD